MFKIKSLLCYALFLLICLIWFVSSLPGDSLPKFDTFGFDKLAHIVMYLFLSILLFVNYNLGLFKKLSRHDLLIFIIMLAALEESHQVFIQFRAVSVLDLSANLFGIFLGYFLIKSFDKKNDRI
jgi:VanZ family protein